MYHACPIRCITDPIFFSDPSLGYLFKRIPIRYNISIKLMNHARCRQYIAMHFGEEAAENVLVYEDEGFSGGNLERPQFKKMMKDSQKITFAAIVVYRLDRISRNIGDFAERAEFDGEHGIMVYNRSLQHPGKANQIRPMEEWIVAVGKHPGIIAGGDRVRVQAMLDVNRSKSYRRPRSNVAPLSHCSSSNST